MSQGYSSARYGHGVSYAQVSNPIQARHHGSIDNAFHSDNSISSYEDLMNRSLSNDGTQKSWQWVDGVDESPSPPVNSSPELATSIAYPHFHGEEHAYQGRGLVDDDYHAFSHPLHHPTRELSSRNAAWVEQTLGAQNIYSFNPTFDPPTSTYGTTYGITSSTSTTNRGLTALDPPWSQFGQYSRTPASVHELVAATTAFALPTYDLSMDQQISPTSQYHQSGNFDHINLLDSSRSCLPEYVAPPYRSRSSSNSQIILTPPEMVMDLPCSSSQIPRQLSPLSMEQNIMSQSLIAQAGSDNDFESSPSSSSEYVLVNSKHPTSSASTTRRKRQRTASSAIPSNGQNHGKFIKLSLSTNQYNNTQNQSGVSKKLSNRARGGRKKGAHLSSDKADEARAMRHVVACWVCALQRDHCTMGSVCDRCVKRHERGAIDANHGLGCVREKLFDYLDEFIPHHVQFVYGEGELRRFADEHIGRFLQMPVRIEIQPIKGLPRLPCELYEFEPTNKNHLLQHQYWQNAHTRQYHPVRTVGAPITFRSVGTNSDEQATYEKYVTGLASMPQHMRHFARYEYFEGERNTFLARLLTILVEFEPQVKGKVEFVKSINKLLLTCFIFARGCQIPEHEHYKLQRLKFFQENQTFSFMALPRMASRQFKHIFLQILTKNLEVVLRRLDRVFRSSQGCKEWIMAFYGVIGLAMAFEYLQNMARTILHSEYAKHEKPYDQAQSTLNFILARIDEKFFFVSKLFRLKYNKSFNPIVNEESRDRLDPEGSQLVTRVTELLNQNSQYLHERQRVQPTLDRTDTYIGRLVAHFLCSVTSP